MSKAQERSTSWLEKVWMEVQAEIDYETAHPQGDPSDCSCFGSDRPCVKCGIGERDE